MQRTILIIEDEAAIADNLSYALQAEGFHAHHVSLGEHAVDVLRSTTLNPALIVLDVGLPDINGFEVCRRLRQLSECATAVVAH